ncbi:Hypothetical predicted protein [Paramuricea clavata]|uniref:Uncharacterized protein n=1 Tax=Paramuricea clavata TaxID=317549 RepID=A0A6S7IFQ1_PARCT|nr:Hypothetical predicted protein [Paramuricea clavata]
MDTHKSQCPRVDPPQVSLTSSSANETSVHPDKRSAPSAPADVPAGPDSIPIVPATPTILPGCVMDSDPLTANTLDDSWHLQLPSSPSPVNPSKIPDCPSPLLFPDSPLVKDSSHLPSPTISESSTTISLPSKSSRASHPYKAKTTVIAKQTHEVIPQQFLRRRTQPTLSTSKKRDKGAHKRAYLATLSSSSAIVPGSQPDHEASHQ